MMDARNDFLYVVDADGTEHHVNLDTVVEVTFDQAGVASLYTAAPLPAQQGRGIPSPARRPPACARRSCGARAGRARRWPGTCPSSGGSS